MEIRKAYLEMIKKFPGGWDAICGALAMTRDALENRIYERKGQGVLVDTAMQVQKFSGTTYFAEAVAAASGGTFVKLPDDISADNELLNKKFHDLYAELGLFSSHFSDATADDVIDKREKADLTAIADEMHKTLSELLALTFRIYCRDEGKPEKKGGK
ncbi:hypothetical protein AAKU55_005290 [Oxalobacteraceae bacterium GrIS 1.11]